MNAPLEEWGRRLSDALRAALQRPDFAAALRLAEEGDGQTRSLAQEYTFMFGGLCTTLEVVLRALETLRQKQALPAEAEHRLVDLIQEFATGFRLLLGGSSHSAVSSFAAAVQSSFAALHEARSDFKKEQGQWAADVVRAIQQQDAATAIAIVDAKDEHYLRIHDRMLRFMADAFAWVLHWMGQDGLLQFQLAVAEGQREGFAKWEQMSPRDFAWTSAFLLKQHMGRVSVTEDESRFTIHQALCGSGGRMRLNGWYSGAGALPFVEGPGPLTFGEPRTPVYCSHCAIWNGSATIRWFGHAQWVFDQPAQADGSCTLHIYKRGQDIPEGYTRRVSVPPMQGPPMSERASAIHEDHQ